MYYKPVKTPIERYNKIRLLLAALIVRPIAAQIAPTMVTRRQPYRFTNMLAIGPDLKHEFNYVAIRKKVFFA